VDEVKYLSVCSGIEAATAAWHKLGWEPVAFSEIEKFPSAVLKHHYPNVPNWGDMTKYKEWPDATIDVLVGGTPCQSFSVAGLRKGLADPRGNLMLTFGAIAGRYKPRWMVWENVPGVLSSNGGKDFGSFLGMLGELGYGFAYRVLDAQYLGVAQRRRRVFVVGYLGDWRPAAAVLFERESLSGHPAPSRKAGERIAPTVSQGAPFSRTGNERVEAEAMVFTQSAHADYKEGVGTLRSSGGDLGGGSESLLVAKPLGAKGGVGRMDLDNDTVGTLRRETHGHEPIICMATGQGGAEIAENKTPTLNCNHEAPILATSSVRRLTPRECERLQGFPDDYTLLPGHTADEPRYKALGNSMAVPVMAWIGERINLIEGLHDHQTKAR
jgi:DNA (cytosine-5)-methyltransferase 1